MVDSFFAPPLCLVLLTVPPCAPQGKLLRYDHQERLTGKEAMAHTYFATVRERESRNMELE